MHQCLLRTDTCAGVQFEAFTQEIQEMLISGLDSCLQIGHLGSEHPAETSLAPLPSPIHLGAHLLTDFLEQYHFLREVLRDVPPLLQHPRRPRTTQSLHQCQ